MKYALITLASLASFASAHFKLNYPPARGFDEDKLPTFPCGGQDTVSTTRTPWPLTGGQIALDMGHLTTNIEVLIGLGDSVGSAFNTIIRPTLTEQGLGNFCFSIPSLPAGLNVSAGTPATIQVVSNGDPTGGLYNCADITFATSATAPACTNATALTITADNIKGNANETTPGGSTTGASTSSSAASPSSTKKGGATTVSAGLGGLVVVGMAALAAVL